MTLLQIAETGEGAIEVLHRYDQPAGTCLLCTHLFDTIESVAVRYGLDLLEVLAALNA